MQNQQMQNQQGQNQQGQNQQGPPPNAWSTQPIKLNLKPKQPLSAPSAQGGARKKSRKVCKKSRKACKKSRRSHRK